MITPVQIEEWIREVEERPSSAGPIIRLITTRLSELADRNEALLAENVALQTEKRVQEYENRIANLEYQLEMLKRQVGGAVAAPQGEALSLLIYDGRGRILRVALGDLSPGAVAASFSGEAAPGGNAPRLLVVSSQEELLCVYDSGRAVSMPVAEIASLDRGELDWGQAYLQEPRGGETLATILPIGRMSLFDSCVQVSRRGFVKKIRESFLESCIAKANVGSGVVAPADKTCDMALCDEDDLLVMVSKEGHLLSMTVSQLPYTIEEALRLGATDHVVAAFVIGEKGSILALTQNGKVFHREVGWLAPAGSARSQRKSALSKARRQAGTRIVGAAAVDDDDWGVILRSDGKLMIHKMGDVFSRGSLLAGSAKLEILSFAAFSGE